MKRTITFLAFACIPFLLFSQHEPNDSSKLLSEIVIHAFEQNRQLKEATAAVNYISQSELERFNSTSVLPALNSTPGVRMEERSPGSYRMNVRGSTLRSPFGVRNVKIYWNDLPLTDPSGNTYLNQLAYYDFNSIEIIKGPGSSLYGSGSGGVILINATPSNWQTGINASYIGGSFGLDNFNMQARWGNEESKNTARYSHLQSDGYRDHTNMRRDVGNWLIQIKASPKQDMKAAVLYSDLYYQTPGGLNKAEYTANPRMARPKAGILPSADSAKAAIYQKTFFAGLSNMIRIGEHWQNKSVLYGAFTNFKNPTFRAYEKRMEPHFGGRTVMEWKNDLRFGHLQMLVGAEAQKGFFNTKTFANVNGNPGAIQTDDDLNNWTYCLFIQGDLQANKDWNITAGISSNRSSVTITRLSVPGFVPVTRTYSNEFAPRLAVSKRIIQKLWLYGSIAKGFSPPTVAELFPGTVTINTTLEPEEGTNYEIGTKSSWLKDRLYVEVNAFLYKLNQAIVVRKDASNANYYINAGETSQKGIEAQAYYLLDWPGKLIRSTKIGLAFTHNNFHYTDFKQGTTDFSGKQLPSVAPNTVAASLDVLEKHGLFWNVTYYYSDPIALNDANTFFADAYHLLGMKLGWKKTIHKNWGINLFTGADNLFNTIYSLGNDINAAGDRYYNAAPGRNYFAGLAINWFK